MEKTELVEIVESSIDNLIATFKETPYFFYTENDLHAFLYHEIYRKLKFKNWQCLTRDKKSSVLLHKEYPTKQRYSARALRSIEKGARGHFDLCIWNPEETRNRQFRATESINFKQEQHTFVAIEFDMIEGNDSLNGALHHLKWDLLKLGDRENEVEYGYCLVFARDWTRSREFLSKITRDVKKNRNTVILYVEKNKKNVTASLLSSKPFLEYKCLQ